jgi:hypothetical protein
VPGRAAAGLTGPGASGAALPVHGPGDAGTIDAPPTNVPVLPFLVLAAWGMAGLAVTTRIMTRRA